MDHPRIRRSVPDLPIVSPEAAERHRDGVSCIRPAAYVYDANGYKRWCVDCGAPLGEEASWHPEGMDASSGLLSALMVLAGLIVVIVLAFVWISDARDDPGPMQTPTTYGQPTHGVVR
jgi:hypothetical protein